RALRAGGHRGWRGRSPRFAVPLSRGGARAGAAGTRHALTHGRAMRLSRRGGVARDRAQAARGRIIPHHAHRRASHPGTVDISVLPGVRASGNGPARHRRALSAPDRESRVPPAGYVSELAGEGHRAAGRIVRAQGTLAILYRRAGAIIAGMRPLRSASDPLPPRSHPPWDRTWTARRVPAI